MQACSLEADILNGKSAFNCSNVINSDVTTDEIIDYGNGSQSLATSDPIEEVITRLSNKTSPTPSDTHKVVIEVTDIDAENSKGALHFALLY